MGEGVGYVRQVKHRHSCPLTLTLNLTLNLTPDP